MKCKRVRELMGAYIHGDLSPQEMRDVRLHSEECVECREDLASRVRIASALPSSVPELSDVDRQRLMWSVKGAIGAREREESGMFRRLVPAFGLAAVLALGLVIGSFVAVHPSKSPSGRRSAHKPKDWPRIEVRDSGRKDVQTPVPDETAQQTDKREIEQGGGVLRSPLAMTRDTPDQSRRRIKAPDKPLHIVPDAGTPNDDGQDKPQKLPKPVEVEDADAAPSE